MYTRRKTKELQVTLYCPLTPPVTKQSAHAITLHDTDRRYSDVLQLTTTFDLHDVDCLRGLLKRVNVVQETTAKQSTILSYFSKE